MKRTTYDLDIVTNLLNQGMSWRQIDVTLGKSKGCTQFWLKRNGYIVSNVYSITKKGNPHSIGLGDDKHRYERLIIQSTHS